MNVDCPATLRIGATCSIQVTFQPIAGSADLRTAALNVPVDSTGISLSIPLSGNAIQSGPVATSTTVTSSLNPSVYNQSVTFTASVSSPGGTPAGSVTFSDGATALGTFTLQRHRGFKLLFTGCRSAQHYCELQGRLQFPAQHV